MIKRTFAPGFRIRLHQKDLNLALQAGRELGVALPNTASTQQLFAAVAAAGGADLDHSGLVKSLETLAAHPVAPDACSGFDCMESPNTCGAFPFFVPLTK